LKCMRCGVLAMLLSSQIGWAGSLFETGPSGPTKWDDQLVAGVGSVLISPIASVAGSVNGDLELSFIMPVGGSIYIVKGIAGGSERLVEVLLEPINGGEELSIKVAVDSPLANPEAKGKKVKADAAPIGTVLSDPEQNKVLGLIPNDAGKALLEHGRVPG